MGQPRPLFCLFSCFSITILQKKCRPQRDSNSDCRSSRRARWPLDHHHGPTFNSLMMSWIMFLIKYDEVKVCNVQLIIQSCCIQICWFLLTCPSWTSTQHQYVKVALDGAAILVLDGVVTLVAKTGGWYSEINAFRRGKKVESSTLGRFIKYRKYFCIEILYSILVESSKRGRFIK